MNTGCLSLLGVLILFILILSFSLSAIGSGSTLMGVILLATNITMLFIYLKSSSYKKFVHAVQQAKREKVSELNPPLSTSLKRQETLLFTELQIKQILESIALIENTERIDVLKSSFKFLSSVLSQYLVTKERINVDDVVAKGIALYRKMYYDRIISETQIEILKNPNCINDNIFYANNIVRCFMKYANTIEKQIDSLKTEKAKDRRKTILADTGRICAQELVNCGKCNLIPQLIERLKDFEIIVDLQYKKEDGDISSPSLEIS